MARSRVKLQTYRDHTLSEDYRVVTAQLGPWMLIHFAERDCGGWEASRRIHYNDADHWCALRPCDAERFERARPILRGMIERCLPLPSDSWVFAR